MNEFTKDELNLLIFHIGLTEDQKSLDLAVKIQSLIDNYSIFNKNQIAKSHLDEAENLISHAKCLLGLNDE